MSRYFVRMPSVALAAEAANSFMMERGTREIQRAEADPNLFIAELDSHDLTVLQEQGGVVYEDIQFEPFQPFDWAHEARVPDLARSSRSMLLDGSAGSSLDQVLEHVKAPQAWTLSRGGGVTIAVVDTGICGSLAEFPASMRSPLDLSTAFKGQHWSDVKGHGSMCAAVAAGTKSMGGKYNGIAPDATLLAARTTLSSVDLFNIFDGLIAARRRGKLPGPLVITNSYGLYTCEAPAGLPDDHPYLQVVLTAIDEGAFVVFAAGNNHHDVLCGHDPQACGPNTIWGVNSHDRVMCVGTVNADNSNQDSSTPHVNSSRGPGQWAERYPKPDCVAPTYGEVVWGCGYRHMEWWGTSGACPQVAGLAALILSVRPKLLPAEVAQIIRDSCVPLGAAPECVGHGLIDCEAAVKLALSRP